MVYSLVEMLSCLLAHGPDWEEVPADEVEAVRISQRGASRGDHTPSSEGNAQNQLVTIGPKRSQ